ncbi:NUDIX domain-containing protein [Amycolatopsis eburnea]|nr:NUDIX domain-containing protein [Amycolatopsis eburnea]
MLNYNKDANARRGGVDLVISLTKDQADALGDAVTEFGEALDTVLVGLAALRSGRDPIRAGGPSLKDTPVSAGTMWQEWVLQDVATLTSRLEGVQAATVRAHAEAGGSFGALATAMGVARATAQSRRTELLRGEPDAAELWATGKTAPVDHPGVKVPANMRSWSTPWPAYLPVDITPAELQTTGLTASVLEGWAEPYPEIDDVPDWQARHDQALVRFDFDDRWRPLNPQGRAGRTGRNLGKWGENAAADPIVVAGTGEDRRVLLIRRKDVGRWAIPGGMVDPGETAPATLVRELREETGVDLAATTPVVLGRAVVDDWRNTDHAWVASTAALFELEETVPATAGDDAADARWWPLPDDVDELAAALASEGGLYEPHRPLLRQALEHLAR